MGGCFEWKTARDLPESHEQRMRTPYRPKPIGIPGVTLASEPPELRECVARNARDVWGNRA